MPPIIVMSTQTLSAADNGKTVNVGVGDVIVIRLPENPTTGYRWFLERVDEPLLETEDDSFSLDPNPQIGSGGTRELRFRSKAPGRGAIALKHWQEWSGEQSVTERFALQVHSARAGA
ncbi:MAG: protease inhibitor I42 family protein [Actinomycetota bacterium]|nr:protease inhibitor I42 family protein [Actinomycetota bacterium]